MSGGLVVLASTVKDTLANVQRYVDGNLAGGADHLVLFLDAPDDPATPHVRGFLDAHPHVTCVVTDDAWWTDKRPEQLNTRQRINANVVKALLSTVDWAGWVFHVDGDEIVPARPCGARRRPRLPGGGEPGPVGGRLPQVLGRRPDLVQTVAGLRRPDPPQDAGRARAAFERSAVPRPRRGQVGRAADHRPVADPAPRGGRGEERGRGVHRPGRAAAAALRVVLRRGLRPQVDLDPRPPARSRTSGPPASPPRSPCRR